MKLEQMVRSLVKTILEAEQKGTKPYDTTAEVVRVDGETAWVHLTGGIEETPVKMTINVVKGDIVQVRVSGGDAWITGNLTKPPTDDQLAKEAKKHAEIADLRAKKAQQMANKTQEEIDSTAQEFANAIIGINQDIDDLQSQIDGEITSWFYDTDPAMNKPPVTVDPDNPDQTGWDTDEKKQRHVGDTYTNVDSGNSWRWIFYEGEYSWLRISDSDVQRALDLASQAKDTADSKRRVFVSTPTPPYDIGDLWVQGTSGDILRCSTAKITGQSFAQSDWVKASKYTDDTVANQAVTLAQQAQTSANGKNKIYHGSTQPSSASSGDTWFNSAEDNAIYVYNGSSWVKQELGEDAIANLSITNAKIADGTIQNAKIGNLDAGKITSGTIDSNRLNIAQIISVGDIAVEGDIPTKLSQLTNDSSYATTGQVSTAKNEAITTASADATSKANQAESNAVATASADATSKANQAESNAVATASADATSKANQAESNAVATASADATAKANEAKKTATNFLTVITGTTGISVHDVNDTSNYVNIASNLFKIVTGGVERFKAWVENNVAKIRVGAETAGHVLIQSSGMDIYGGDGTENLAHIGYDYGEDGQGGTSQAPFYTFGTRQNNQPVGNYSVSEGFNNEASGYASHAEGYNTTASGNYSHAEGIGTEASWNQAHAEGVFTEAKGAASHAEGLGTIARDHQHVQGKYNVEDVNKDFADIIGAGYADLNRENIEATTWTGDKRMKGDVYVGCNDDSTGGNKVISEAQIDIGEHSFSNLASNTATSISVTFNKTFASAPQVVAGLKSSLTSANTGNVAVSASNVTTTGFTLRAYNGSTAQKTIYVSWIAVGI